MTPGQTRVLVLLLVLVGLELVFSPGAKAAMAGIAPYLRPAPAPKQGG